MAFRNRILVIAGLLVLEPLFLMAQEQRPALVPLSQGGWLILRVVRGLRYPSAACPMVRSQQARSCTLMFSMRRIFR